MASAPKYVVSLTDSSATIDDDRILVIIRNMAGHDMYLAVKKIATVWDVRFHVAETLGRISDEIKLMLNYNQIYASITRIAEIQPVLEANHNVIHLLVEEHEEMPHWDFVCHNCLRECKTSDCVEWDPNPEYRCRNCDNGHMCCYMLDDDE